ncbi:MAG: flagellar biosynthesis protein FlhA [Clostridiales bacterium]|nr:flagellar biosynthesis protein FlhA [Clostridiales bacterium]
MKHKEVALGVFIIVIVAVIIIPIPTFSLDFLIMLNIGLSILVILDALYSREALSMSLFPTVLLIMTLFRMALNISAIRLILGKGYAGAVINAFGSFVAGGNIIVGSVIFAVIILVNFLVITKGSERVAEVTARFTLDAMPGKQMAIDADLNAGVINDDEAKARRKKIQDEANFYGAMDGASKFVKGDAISGLLIAIINIIGGLTLGVTGIGGGPKLSLAEAAEKYSIMTIGDGLVHQLPALLISVATGIIVTKTTGDEDISSSIASQILNKPIALYITGFVMIALGALMPFPRALFLPFGAALIYAANRRARLDKVEKIRSEITAEEGEDAVMRRPENVASLLGVDPILLLFGYGLIPLVDSGQGGDLLDRVVMIRRQIAVELGAIVPVIRLRDDINLSPGQYKILIKGVPVAGGEIMFGHYMAMNPGYVEREIEGIETTEPYMGLPAVWITENQRERAESYGYTVVDPPSIIATHMTEIIRSSLHELLTRQDTQTLIDNVKERNPVLVEELIPKLLTVGEVQKTLSNLLKEGVSIRDFVTILETLADYAPSTRDIDALTEYARQALRGAISNNYLEEGVNNVITLDPKLEREIMENVRRTEQGSYLALDPEKTKRIFESLNSETAKLSSAGLQPIALTSPMVRLYFKRLVEQIAPSLVVLSYNEIDPKAEIQSIGMVSIA